MLPVLHWDKDYLPSENFLSWLRTTILLMPYTFLGLKFGSSAHLLLHELNCIFCNSLQGPLRAISIKTNKQTNEQTKTITSEPLALPSLPLPPIHFHFLKIYLFIPFYIPKLVPLLSPFLPSCASISPHPIPSLPHPLTDQSASKSGIPSRARSKPLPLYQGIPP